MRKNANLPALIFVFILLVLWQAGAMGMDAAYILPSPTQILARLWELRGPLFTAHLPATLLCTGIGLAISVVLGLLLAVLMDASPAAEKMLYPLIVALADHPHDRACAAVRALTLDRVLLYDLEQGAGHSADHLFPHRHHGVRRLPLGQDRYGRYAQDLRRGPEGDLLQAQAACGAAVLFLRHQNGDPHVHHRRGDRRMAGCAGGARLFQPPHDDQLDGAGVFAPIVLLSAVAMLAVAIVSWIEKKVVTWRGSL